MGIDDLEERLCEARELRVDLELHARRQEGDAFEQSFDVGIRHFEPVHPQPRRNFRKLLRELRTRLAQVLQLQVVVLEEARIHHATRGGELRSVMRTVPVSRSKSVRTRNSSGTGCAHNWP